MSRPATALRVAALAGASAALAGCGTYVLRGTVVQGDVARMQFVDPAEGQPAGNPVGNVRITVQRDPDRLSRHLAGTDVSDARGRFEIALEEFGSGWMDEQWLLRATKQGFETVSSIETLSSKTREKLLLIVMKPGVSVVPREEDLLETYREYR